MWKCEGRDGECNKEVTCIVKYPTKKFKFSCPLNYILGQSYLVELSCVPTKAAEFEGRYIKVLPYLRFSTYLVFCGILLYKLLSDT